MDNAINFSYETSDFEKALLEMAKNYKDFTDEVEKVTKVSEENKKESIEKLETAHKESGKKVEKAEKQHHESSMKKFGAWTVAKGMMLASAIMGIMHKAFESIKENIPEIGMTFKAAGDIMMRNLMWPLRMQLIPLLQKFLIWTKDNRAMFLSFGVVIANAFKIVIATVKMAITFVKQLIEGFKEAFNITRFGETFNILMLKITMFLAILEMKMAPVFRAIGVALGTTIRILGEFVNWLGEIGAGQAALDLLIGSFNGLNTVLQGALDLIQVLKGELDFGNFMQNVEQNVMKTFGLGEKDQNGFTTPKQKKGESDEEYFFKTNPNVETFNGKKNPYFKKNVNVNETAATKQMEKEKGGASGSWEPLTKPLGKPINKNTNVTMGDIKMTVTVTEGNAKNAGIITGHETAKVVMKELKKTLVAGGGR